MAIDLKLDPSLALDAGELQDLLQIWRGHAEAEAVPPWQVFDPLKLPPSLLPHVFLIDSLDQTPPRPRWRLLGTHTTATLGRDYTGKHYDEVYSPEDAVAMAEPPLWVLANRLPVRALGKALFADKEWLRYECVYLPYRGDTPVIKIVLGGIRFEIRR